MNARIIIGANYGDEGKGTIVAKYTKDSNDVLNVLTNGGAQRQHTIFVNSKQINYRHFGSGTFYGADNYYSRFFILNPVQFTIELNQLIVKPKLIYRDKNCMWSTILDSLANCIEEEQKNRHASCGMGIWKTIKRYKETDTINFDSFIKLDDYNKLKYLEKIKEYYEKSLTVEKNKWYYDVWNNSNLLIHFIDDCKFMFENTISSNLKDLNYENMIFENGQGLLLNDTGMDTYDTTPSNTGISDSLQLINELDNVESVKAHYVSRTYLTRHGDGFLKQETNKKNLTSYMNTESNVYNNFQGEFRYGKLNLYDLFERIRNDARNVEFELELTHCDEIDLSNEAKQIFDRVNCTSSKNV